MRPADGDAPGLRVDLILRASGLALGPRAVAAAQGNRGTASSAKSARSLWIRRRCSIALAHTRPRSRLGSGRCRFGERGCALSYELFISYESEDLVYAACLDEALRAEGFSVWFDRARLETCFEWRRAIEEGGVPAVAGVCAGAHAAVTKPVDRVREYSGRVVVPLAVEATLGDLLTPPLSRWQGQSLRGPQRGVARCGKPGDGP